MTTQTTSILDHVNPSDVVNAALLENSINQTVADEELIAGYYRPITKFAGLKDYSQERIFAVFTDRPQAGVCRTPGSLEFIFERKTMSSDWKGVNEVTNDDYDGFFGYTLVFQKSGDIDHIRQLQVQLDLEVLHLIGASQRTDLVKNETVPEYEPAKASTHECLLIDLLPLEKLAREVTVQISFTNVCSRPVDSLTLAQALAVYGLTSLQIKKIFFKTADGVVRRKEGGKAKRAVR